MIQQLTDIVDSILKTENKPTSRLLQKKSLRIAKKGKLRECANCDQDSQDWTHGQDHEGAMAKSEIKDLIANAVTLHNLLGSNDQLPGWVSAYITLASDYIHSVTEHLSGKVDQQLPEQLTA